jgi:hypothetical protein
MANQRRVKHAQEPGSDGLMGRLDDNLVEAAGQRQQAD